MYRKIVAAAGVVSLLLAFLAVKQSSVNGSIVWPDYVDVVVVAIPAILLSLALFTPRKQVEAWIKTAGLALLIYFALYMVLLQYSFSGSAYSY